ncbi:MAG: hypothetical protein K1X71_19465 [Pirellulales bacterium]|nr:hypothetical protein [Pirellulales bacterium]
MNRISIRLRASWTCNLLARGLVIAHLVLVVFAPASSAALIVIGAPPSVQSNALTSNPDMFLFFESQQTLANPLPVDIINPGLYGKANPNALGLIPQGTVVQSYLLHRETDRNTFSSILGGWTAPNNILGIIVSDSLLDATDASLGNPGTLYPTGLAYRGAEFAFPITPDTLFWNANLLNILFNSSAAAVMDQVRIIVAVPEPSMFVLGMTGALGFVLCVHNRRRR